MVNRTGEFREIYTNTYGRDILEKSIMNFFRLRVDLRGFFVRDAEEGVYIREKNLNRGYFFAASVEGGDFVDAMHRAEERYKREGFQVPLNFVDYDARIAGFVWRAGNA